MNPILSSAATPLRETLTQYLTSLRYNTLLDDSDQPPVSDEHITKLAEIFVRHNAQNVLGIHLIHGYFKIPESTVILRDQL